MLLDNLFSNNGFGNSNYNNNSGLGKESSFFNPFATIFGTNSTNFGQLMKNSSLDSATTNLDKNSNSTAFDIMKMLELFQSGQQ
ncbi:MAG TPA: hypothetical protein VLE21_02710 [Candidatus Nitrosocosmicus sp.]|nr:hypothetical protein [Candidatus Nitrosocosmicus sp.]